MGVRSTVGWMVHGRSNTTATLDALSADMHDLQQRVDRLTTALQRIEQDLRDQQLVEIGKVRDAVITATDDLAERIAALHRAAAADGGGS